jgi:ribose/xylose/arabinose/galactoside ABC-type transport system permease subunit
VTEKVSVAARVIVAEFLERAAIWFSLFVLLAIAATISPGFLRPIYLGNLLAQLSTVGIAAVGVTFVMIIGGIDLSVGAVISLSLVICAVEMNGQVANLSWAIGASLLAGTAIGAFNGVLAALTGVSPFILTLGTGLAVYGITQIYSGGTVRGIAAPEFREVLNYRVGGVLPVLAIVFLIIAAGAGQVLTLTRFGRMLYLVGSNPRAARLTGLPVARLTFITYTLSGLLSAVAGIILLARSGVSSTLVGRGLEFSVLAAVMLGGTTFEGGTGGISGTVAGVLVLFVSFNLVNIAGLNFNAQLIVRGVIIIAAAGLYGYLRRRS